MSIESNLESIAASLSVIAAHLTKQPVQTELPLESKPAPVKAEKPVKAPKEAPAPTPDPTPVIEVAEVEQAPAPVEAPDAPFSDAVGMAEYVRAKYRTLGPVKGALIQNALSEIGCKNINEVTPSMYGLFFAKVEAL